MKYNDNGEYKDIYIKTFDTLPVGTEVDYDGETVPDGWSEIETYSTSEVNTGMKWIDGSDIYRIVIRQSISSTTGSIDISTLSINTIIDYKAILYDGNAVTTEYFVSSTDKLRVFFFNNNAIQYRWGTVSSNANTLQVIVEYTKTN